MHHSPSSNARWQRTYQEQYDNYLFSSPLLDTSYDKKRALYDNSNVISSNGDSGITDINYKERNKKHKHLKNRNHVSFNETYSRHSRRPKHHKHHKNHLSKNHNRKYHHSPHLKAHQMQNNVEESPIQRESSFLRDYAQNDDKHFSMSISAQNKASANKLSVGDMGNRLKNIEDIIGNRRKDIEDILSLRTIPAFDSSVTASVMAQLGSHAYLPCRIMNLGDKTVSIFDSSIFPSRICNDSAYYTQYVYCRG